MAGTTRQYRVADQIQRELSVLIRDEVRDPRVSPLATINEVEVSSDLSLAKVFIAALGESEDGGDAGAESAAALRKAAGFLRRQLAARMNLRQVPELRFIHDDSVARAYSISRAIFEARERDRKLSDQ